MEAQKPREERTENSRTRKVVIGFLLVVGMALTFVATSQFGKSTFGASVCVTRSNVSGLVEDGSHPKRNFRAPFFVTYFKAVCLVVCYPIYLLTRLLDWRRKECFQDIWRQSVTVYGADGLTLRKLLTHCGLFALATVAISNAYLRALEDRCPSDVTAIFATNCVFVFLLSALFLGARLISLKLLSVLSAGTGVFLISYADWSGLASLTAVCLILLAAFGAAGYKVALKSVVGDARPDQVCLFLSLVAAFTAVVLWPIILILHFTGVEIIQPEFIPWRLLFSLGGLGLVFNFLLTCGVAYTYPLFASFGGILAVPLNFLVDSTFRELDYGGGYFSFKAAGAVLVILAFVFIAVLPEKVDEEFHAAITQSCKKEDAFASNASSPGDLERLITA